MGKILKKNLSSSADVESKVQAIKEKIASKSKESTPMQKGSLTDKAGTPAPVLKKEKKEKKVKVDPTLVDGMLYGLISRVRNAHNAEQRKAIETKDAKYIDMIDGRGASQKICEAYVTIAKSLGGAEYLKTVRSSHVRKKLFPPTAKIEKADKPSKDKPAENNKDKTGTDG